MMGLLAVLEKEEMEAEQKYTQEMNNNSIL